MQVQRPARVAKIPNTVPNVPVRPLLQQAMGVEIDVEISEMSEKLGLKSAQRRAFSICAKRFLETCVPGHVKKPPLRMLLHGPGGTGKTFVINALQDLMEVHGRKHELRMLAPTGGAASIIDGSTIHNGLGIVVLPKKNAKSYRQPGFDKESVIIQLSEKRKQELRAEWKYVAWLFLDEMSLTSAQLLCEVDQALRFAKESNEWFGGVEIITSGDLCQYSPVGGSAVYLPVRNTNEAEGEKVLKQRLGRMAWKSIDTVVEFNEQERMRDDPEFGLAVQNLRLRKCTSADLKIFNSRVIRSETRPNGVIMSVDIARAAVAIVVRNVDRTYINEEKAASEFRDVFRSAAQDTVDKTLLPQPMRNVVLNMAFSSGKNDKALPGFVSLYMYMPVILRQRNLSVELKITNGSRGYIVDYVIEKDATGYEFSPCVFVYFPDSGVQLEHLPKGVFPIEPVSFTFSTEQKLSDGKSATLRITRKQLPIQPGFAVTGHSSQGQTLKAVLVDMRPGGFHAVERGTKSGVQ